MRNQLEPDGLVQAFMRHPPQGFELLAGQGQGEAPAFCAPFDLLTTADDALRRRMHALLLWRWWGRWLRWRTAFVGTTVTEYLLLPEALVAPLPALWRSLWGRRFALLILKDLPCSSPLLPASHNIAADALVQACERQGYVMVEGQALAYVTLDFTSMDEYTARLSPSRRQNLRRKLRSLPQLDVRRVPAGAAYADDGAVSALYALYGNVYAQSEIHFDRLTPEFFARVLRDAHSGGIVFEYRVAATGELIGWNLCFEHGGNLVDKYIGLAYPQAREFNLYFVSWFVNLQYGLERELLHYIAGWTDPEVKAQLGAKFTMTRHAVWIRNPLLRALARRLTRWFEPDTQWAPKAVGVGSNSGQPPSRSTRK